MAKLSTDDLLDAFKEMTLLELSEFVKQFEDTFNVSAAAPVAVAAGPGAGGAGAAAAEEAEVRGSLNKRPSPFAGSRCGSGWCSGGWARQSPG